MYKSERKSNNKRSTPYDVSLIANRKSINLKKSNSTNKDSVKDENENIVQLDTGKSI